MNNLLVSVFGYSKHHIKHTGTFHIKHPQRLLRQLSLIVSDKKVHGCVSSRKCFSPDPHISVLDIKNQICLLLLWTGSDVRGTCFFRQPREMMSFAMS